MFKNEYGKQAHELVQDLATGRFRRAVEWNVHTAKGSTPNVDNIPRGHCMFVDPYGYGAVPAPAGVPTIPASDLPHVREIIVRAMRSYWHVMRRPHDWREVYPEKSDARAVAVLLARFMSDRKMRFPRER